MKLVQGQVLIKMIFSTLVIPALFLVFSLASARQEARIFLHPIDIVDRTVTLDIIVENATDLYGAEFRLKYDPAVLSPQDLQTEQDGIQIDVGSLLSPEQVFVVANEVEETEGIITFAVSLLQPAPPINETGPLARVVFEVLQDGPATIDLEHAKLVSSDLGTIPSDTTSLTVSSRPMSATGEGRDSPVSYETIDSTTIPSRIRPVRTRVITQPSVDDNDLSWWRIVAVLVMVFGVLILGMILVLGSSSLLVLTVVENRNRLRRRY